MIRTSCNILVLCVLMLFFSFHLYAQKSVKGVVTEEVKTRNGTIKIYRTNHLPRGKTISGTIIFEPESDKPKKQEKQLQQLAGLVFKIGNKIISNDGIFTTTLPDVENVPFQVFDANGSLLKEIALKLSEPFKNVALDLPKTIRVGNIEKITGEFSGDISKAKILLNEKPVDVLAGNDTEIFFKANDIDPGKQDFSLDYDDVKITESVNLIDYSLQAGKLSLNRGESTYLDVTVVGLEDLQEPLELEVQNQSVGTILLVGGDKQTIQIEPEEVAKTGTWQKRFDIQSLTRGSFNIFTELEIDETQTVMETECFKINPYQIVDCEIGGYPTLLPAEVCEKFHQRFDSRISKKPVEVMEDIFPEPEIELSEISKNLLDDKVEATLVLHELSEIRGLAATIFAVETNEIVTDSIFQLIEDTISVILEIPQSAGVYKLQMDAVYADNQRVSFIRYINQIPVISPDAIAQNIRSEFEEERDRITDDIERIERELEENNDAQDNNRRDANREAWEAAQDNEVVRQLEEIDFMLDEVSEIYSETLRELIDTLIKYEANPPKPDLNALNSQVEELEAALAVCKEQLARLEELQKHIPEQIEELENQYQEIYEEMIGMLNAAGYRYENAGYLLNSSRYSRPILLMGWCGYVSDPMSEELTRSTSRAFDEAAPISRQHRRLMTRLAELPQQISAVTAQCDKLAAELDAAKQALLNAENDLEAYDTFVDMLNNSRDEICRQIKNILDRLEQWCNNHLDISGELSEMIDDFMRDCPQSERGLREFWQNWETVLSTKQGIETNHREEAERHAENAEGFRDENSRLREEETSLENQLNRLDRKLRDAAAAYNRALAEARRQRAEERRREIEEKAACLRILTEHWGNSNDENNILGELASIYETFAGITGQGSGGYSDMLDKLNELNSKLSEIKDQIEQVANLLNGIVGEPTNEDRTEAFQEVLDIAGEIGDKVPGFGEMIGFYADAYEAAIGALMGISNQKVEAMKPLVNQFRVGTCPQSDWGDKSLDQILNDKWDRFMRGSGSIVITHRLTNDEQEKLKEYFKQKIMSEILACCLNKITQ